MKFSEQDNVYLMEKFDVNGIKEFISLDISNNISELEFVYENTPEEASFLSERLDDLQDLIRIYSDFQNGKDYLTPEEKEFIGREVEDNLIPIIQDNDIDNPHWVKYLLDEFIDSKGE